MDYYQNMIQATNEKNSFMLHNGIRLTKMEKDGLIRFIREEDKRKIYCITDLGRQVLDLEMKRIDRLYHNMLEVR